MTTHDQSTGLSNSYDEVQTAPADGPPVTEHTAPTAYSDPSNPAESAVPQGEPPAVQSQSQASGALTDTAATPGDATVAATAAPAEAADPARVSSEPSTERALFADDELAGLRARWDSVQAAFVDDPRECVEKADGLVSDLVEKLTAGFADARSRLEEQWARGEQASTEDLRVALQHYREFFQRLLAV